MGEEFGTPAPINGYISEAAVMRGGKAINPSVAENQDGSTTFR